MKRRSRRRRRVDCFRGDERRRSDALRSGPSIVSFRKDRFEEMPKRKREPTSRVSTSTSSCCYYGVPMGAYAGGLRFVPDGYSLLSTAASSHFHVKITSCLSVRTNDCLADWRNRKSRKEKIKTKRADA